MQVISQIIFDLTPIGDIAFVFNTKSRRKGKRILISNVKTSDIVHLLSVEDCTKIDKLLREAKTDLLTNNGKFYTLVNSGITEIKHPQFQLELDLHKELN